MGHPARPGWGIRVLMVLFGTEGVHGFDAGGASCRDESGDGGKSRKDQDRGADCQWVVDSNAVKLARHEAAADECDRYAEGKAESHLPGGGAENEREDVVAVGAESHAQADFAGAARDRVGSDAVQSDGGQHESEQSKQRSEAADEAVLIEISGDLIVESFEIEDGE